MHNHSIWGRSDGSQGEPENRAWRGGRSGIDVRLWPRRAVHFLIRAYQLSLSAFLGRQCRYEPSCSAYMDEAIGRFGVGPGAIMGFARLCRCHPWGNHGFDPVPELLPEGSSWARPWRYGDWRGPIRCDAAPKKG